jgi:hypothetical protein
MSTDLSVAEIFKKLEARLRFHEEQAAFHAQQEVHHREQSALHTAELQKVREHFEAFKATAVAAADLARETVAPPPAAEAEDHREFIGKRVQVTRLIARVLDGIPEGQELGAGWVAQEVNRRYRDILSEPTDARAVSVTLRRLKNAGRLRLIRKGKASHEARYMKV